MSNFLWNFMDWDRDYYSFFRNVKDSYPYNIIRGEGKSTIVFNALGIKKEDVIVDFDKTRGTDYLVIKGKTEHPIAGTCSINGRFVVDTNEISNIEWKADNGLLLIDVYFKKAEKPPIEIKYKED